MQFSNWQQKCGMMVCGIGLGREKESYKIKGLSARQIYRKSEV